jgi:hypothetical protein
MYRHNTRHRRVLQPEALLFIYDGQREHVVGVHLALLDIFDWLKLHC